MASPHVADVLVLCHERLGDESSPAQIKACVIDNGTPNVVRYPGNGSPHLLLYAKANEPTM